MENTTLNEYIEKGLIGKSELTKKTYRSALIRFEEWLQGAGATFVLFILTGLYS